MTAAVLTVGAGERRLVDAAAATVLAATLFNLVLCFLMTRGLPVGTATTVSVCEIAISAVALVLARRGIDETTVLLLLSLGGSLLGLWLIRGGTSPKIIRDLLIPIIYFKLGSTRSSPERADALVYGLVVLVLAVALFEWFALPLYTALLDIPRYYIDKGALSSNEYARNLGTWVGLFASGLRPEGRDFLPFLGPHRVSSVFLEPIEEANFAVIAACWLLCRFNARPRVNLAFIAVCVILMVLADSRFAMIVCGIILLAHVSGASRSTLGVLLMPVAVIAALMLLSDVWHPVVALDTVRGRLFTSGAFLASFTPSEWFGLREAIGPTVDAGYAYLFTYAGAPIAVFLWLLFTLRSAPTRQARAMRGAIALYAVLSLCIGPSMFSIKTAALLWFLYGSLSGEQPT